MEESSGGLEVNQGMARQTNMPWPVNPLNQYGDSVVKITNPESEIYKLELVLRGAVLDANGQVQKDARGNVVGFPLMNELGINKVIGMTQSMVNQNTIMGNLDRVQVDGMRNMFADTLAINLMLNRIKWDIKNNDDRRMIFCAALMYGVPALSRGFEGDEKKFLGKAVTEFRNTVDQPKKRQSLFQDLVGMGK